jgi:hypothetical protein
MGITLDRDVETVLAFMERNIEMNKLGRVAEKVAALAPVLWVDQDLTRKDRLIAFTPESFRGQLATATELDPARVCECGGSVVVAGSPQH